MLKKVLEAREERWNLRLRLVREFDRPLLTFTLNIPGPEKTGEIFLRAHRKVLEELLECLKNRQVPILHLQERKGFDGPEAFLVLDTSSRDIKKMVLSFEENHPVGRVLDLDVMDEKGKCLSREQSGLPPRKCVLCDAPARECIVLRRHESKEVFSKVVKMVEQYLKESSK